MNTCSKASGNGKPRKGVAAAKLSTDPQSVAARQRRHRISDRFKILQSLVPGGSKMDTVSMLEEAIQYVKFLKAQIWLHQAMISFVEIDNINTNSNNNADADPTSTMFPIQNNNNNCSPAVLNPFHNQQQVDLFGHEYYYSCDHNEAQTTTVNSQLGFQDEENYVPFDDASLEYIY